MFQTSEPDFSQLPLSVESEQDHGDKIDDPSKSIVLYPARNRALESWKKRIPLLLALVPLLLFSIALLVFASLRLSSLLCLLGLNTVAWILTTGCYVFVTLYLVGLPITLIRARNALRRSTSPVLVISTDGLTIDLGPFVGTLDTIHWKDIGEVYVKKSFGEHYLGINVRGISRYAPTFRSRLLLVYPTFFMRLPTICIPEHFLHLDVSDVANLINERRTTYDASVRGHLI